MEPIVKMLVCTFEKCSRSQSKPSTEQDLELRAFLPGLIDMLWTSHTTPKLSNTFILLFSASGTEPSGYMASSTDRTSVCSLLQITLYSSRLGNGP